VDAVRERSPRLENAGTTPSHHPINWQDMSNTLTDGNIESSFKVPSGYPEAYLWPAIRKLIEEREWPVRTAFDLG